MSEPAIEYVKTLELGDDDVVVLRFGERVGTYALEAIKRDLEAALGGRRVIAIAPGLGIGGVPMSGVRAALEHAIAGDVTPGDRVALRALLEAVSPEPAEDREPF